MRLNILGLIRATTLRRLYEKHSPGDIAFVSIVPRALTSILRPESGAIGPDEIGSYLQAYIPMQEGPDKLHGLRSEIEGLRRCLAVVWSMISFLAKSGLVLIE